MPNLIYTLAFWAAALPTLTLANTTAVVSELESFRVEVVAEGLRIPWTLKFLPDGRALVGEREAGRLSLLDLQSGQRQPIEGLPSMFRSGANSSGLFDVLVHPQFATNQTLFLAYGIGDEAGNGLAVASARLRGSRLEDLDELYTPARLIAGKWHFGGRLALADGNLYISTGDGYDFSAQAQDLSSPAGKILRIREDGGIPRDNPFLGRAGALPEIFAYGVRNPQGMAVHPETGAVWINEHGPQGGDEINIVTAGTNFGWPQITYGEEYGGGPIGAGLLRQPGMAQPHYYWDPSIAPSGLQFYAGQAFPNWRGSLFSGSLAFTHLNRLTMDGDRILHEERLLAERNWRIRFVEQGPDGYLYLGNDDGQILRLVPE